MKKILAFLLVLCMVVGLAACGKGDGGKETTGAPTGNTGNSGGLNIDTTYEGSSFNPNGDNEAASKITNNDDCINPEAFGGKTLELYGFSSAAYDEIEDMGYGNFIWMMRAAVDEWAKLNNVTIKFEGDYDQNTLMGAINSGEKPDLLLHCDHFPTVAALGLVRELTDEEVAKLSETCGMYYLDMMKYKEGYYGVNYPWSGCSLFYYNKTMFEEYGEKTPKEYYMEGNWTWDTMESCLKAVTKDLDGDGKMDTYGNGYPYRGLTEGIIYTENSDGKLELVMETTGREKYMRFLEIVYDGYNVDKFLGEYGNATVSTNPRPATHIGDAEPYNFSHVLQYITNGDVIEAIPIPSYNKDTELKVRYTPAFMSILTTCDEPEATLSLMTYILRVGMRYMNDYSLGLYKCSYEGMRGATDYSAGWIDNFAWVVEERQAEFATLQEDWDQEMYEKMLKDLQTTTDISIFRYYPGGVTTVDENKNLPAASAFPLDLQKYKTFVDNYNNMYAN